MPADLKDTKGYDGNPIAANRMLSDNESVHRRPNLRKQTDEAYICLAKVIDTGGCANKYHQKHAARMSKQQRYRFVSGTSTPRRPRRGVRTAKLR